MHLLSKKHLARSIPVTLVFCALALLTIGLLRSSRSTVNAPARYTYPGIVQTFTANTCMSHLTLETGSFRPSAQSGKIQEVNLPDGVSAGRSFGNTYIIDIDGFSVPFADTYSDQLKLLHPDCIGVLPNATITCQLRGAVTPTFIQQCLEETGTLPVKPDACRATYVNNLFNEYTVDNTFTFTPDSRFLLYAPHGFHSNVAFERFGYFYVSRDSSFHGHVLIAGNDIQLFQWTGDHSQDIRATVQSILNCASSYWTFIYYQHTQW